VKPCFSDWNVQLYNADVLEALVAIPESSVDLVFADPPYNLSNDGITCQSGEMVSVNKGDWDRSKGIEEDYKFHFDWINACRRVLKPNGSIWISGTYHSIYLCGYALQKQAWHIINDICWFKPNASPNLSCRMFTASHETLIWAKKSREAKHCFNYEDVTHRSWKPDFLKNPHAQMRSVWSITSTKAYEKAFGKHPTQKPEELLNRIILSSTEQNHTVLDPFCGSGTTGVSALKAGRRFIGIDSNEEYLIKLAVPRIKAVNDQYSLFPCTTDGEHIEKHQ
jgi:site-specific DNA-methyltransferase (adenine-specific)